MALTRAGLKKTLVLIGVFSNAVLPVIDQLVRVDKMIEAMQKQVDEKGILLVQQSREGNDRYITNPIIPELTKQQALKSKLLDQLLLTPQSLSKTDLKKTTDDGFEDEE